MGDFNLSQLHNLVSAEDPSIAAGGRRFSVEFAPSSRLLELCRLHNLKLVQPTVGPPQVYAAMLMHPLLISKPWRGRIITPWSCASGTAPPRSWHRRLRRKWPGWREKNIGQLQAPLRENTWDTLHTAEQHIAKAAHRCAAGGSSRRATPFDSQEKSTLPSAESGAVPCRAPDPPALHL